MSLAIDRAYAKGRYLIKRRLDRESPGAYSAVYLAEDREDKRRVAVKESLAQTDTAHRRFERERRIQERLGVQSPYVVRVLGVDDFGSSHCLILEYLSG